MLQSEQEYIPAMAHRLSLIAKLKNVTQEQLAHKCRVSRITINRFFRGHSDLRATEFVALLAALDIPLEEQLNQHMDMALNGMRPPKDPIYHDVALLMEQMEKQVRKTVVEQILWWTRNVARNQASLRAIQRLTQYAQNLATREK